MQILRSFVDRIQFVVVFIGVFIGLTISAADAGAQTTETFEVTNLFNTGTGSLSAAIDAANASTASTKTITFASTLDGTINLSSNLPAITNGVTIDGSTAVNIIVDGTDTGTTHIFQVTSGTTTVEALTLQNAPLKIGSGASLAFDGSADQQFDDVITDAGKLIKDGAATLTLRGANNYTGGTEVRAGTLLGDTTSLQGNITNKALVVFDQDAGPVDEYAGVITGTGAVQKTGADEVHFTGANTYTGGTTISAGALRGDVSSLQGNIAVETGGTVIFDQDAGTKDEYAGVISGTGAVQKTGVDEIKFTGANTYTGGTTISAGALRGDASSLQGDVVVETDGTVNGTVIFDHDTNGTYAGNLSGGGVFTKMGTGTLTLSGTNTISGLSSLDAGALQGDFASIPLDLSAALGTEVIFNHANNGTYAGAISGDGSLTKAGSGTLSLAGDNTFTGLTSIMAGRLDVDGSLDAGVNVGASAWLGGTGRIDGSVAVDGTLAPGTVVPGNSVGTLSVDAVTFTSGSVFEVEVDAGVADLLEVTGTADLGGATVQVGPVIGNYSIPVDVTILNAGSISNSFAPLDLNFLFLDITMTTPGSNSVMLTIERNPLGLLDFAQTPNQTTIAAALEEALEEAQLGGGGSDIETVFESLDGFTEVQDLLEALDSMTGESLTQFATTRLAAAERFGRALGARVLDHQWANSRALIGAKNSTGEASGSSADSIGSASNPVFGVAMLGVGPMGAPGADTGARADLRIRTWVDGSAIYGDVDGNSSESGFDYNIWGGSLGADVRLAEHWILGLAGGYANTNLDFASRPGDGDVNTYQGALYAGYVDPRFHVGVSGRYAYNDMEGKREIQFGAEDRTARADLDGHDFGARLEGGLNLLDLGGIVFQPTVSLNYNRLTQDDVTESGADDLNLALEDSDLDSLALGVGMRVRGRWEMGADTRIVPELHGRWLHEFLDTDRLIEARLVSAPADASASQIQGVELPRDAGSVGFAWSVITPSAWRITASYDAVLNQDLVQHMGSIALSLKW